MRERERQHCAIGWRTMCCFLALILSQHISESCFSALSVFAGTLLYIYCDVCVVDFILV